MESKEQYTALMARHRGLVWRLCRQQARGDWDYCCDLVQEVAMSIWEHRDKLRSDASAEAERAWVRWQARSTFDRLSRRKRVALERLQKG